MKLKQVDSLLLKVLFLVEAGIVVTQVMNLDSITSMLFLLTFPLTMLLWIRANGRGFFETDMIVVVTSVLATIAVLMNAAKVSAHMDFSYLKKLIMFIMALLFFQMAHRSRIDEGMSAFIRRVVDILVIFLILMYFLQNEQMHTLNGRHTIYLTFCFTNPNLTALFLTCLYMIKMQRLFEGGMSFVKLLNFLQQLMLGWLVIETRSRNAVLVLGIYTVMMVWLIFRSRRKLRITRGWALLFAVLPAALVAGYMLLIYSDWVMEAFSFLVGEGKKLDSRVEVWSQALSCLKESPVFGAYYEISGGTGLLHMHNSHLDIAASYGVPVLVLVCILLFRYLHQQGRVYQNKKNYVYIIGFACAILLGVGEAAVFSGGLGVYIMAGACLLLANKAENTENGG